MGFELTNFDDPTLDSQYLSYLIEQEAVDAYLHFSRLWDYFRNPMSPAAGAAAEALNSNSRPYFQAQEVGLPARITGIARFGPGGEQMTDLARKEVVIENDIGWRIQTGVEFLFGKPVSIRSLAGDKTLAAAIESIITGLLEANGGQTFLQELALLGSVYGFVDVVLRTPPDWPGAYRPAQVPPSQPGSAPAIGAAPVTPAEDGRQVQNLDPQDAGTPRSRTSFERAAQLARALALEIVEAPRILPILGEDDFRAVRYWIQTFRKQTAALDHSRPFMSFGWAGRRDVAPRTVEVVEILGPSWHQRYEDRVLVAEGPHALGRVPVVHVQNLSLPGSYEGLSDVEALVPLQDELNTRLSDRSCRVTYQSFKMYLAKGIDDFLERPVGPGQMWATHNLDASVQEFGHDSGSPSEDGHIEQVRQALDKVSGVTPLAAGLIRGNVGNLTSATALKVLLSGLLARTQRKRITYARGISQVVELVLSLLDRAGVLRTRPEDRRLEVHWPSPLPEDEAQALANAQLKAALGVPRQRVLAELGYAPEAVGGGQ